MRNYFSAPHVSYERKRREFPGTGGDQRQRPWLCRRLDEQFVEAGDYAAAFKCLLVVGLLMLRRSRFFWRKARVAGSFSERDCGREWLADVGLMVNGCGGGSSGIGAATPRRGGNNTTRDVNVDDYAVRNAAGSTKRFPISPIHNAGCAISPKFPTGRSNFTWQ